MVVTVAEERREMSNSQCATWDLKEQMGIAMETSLKYGISALGRVRSWR